MIRVMNFKLKNMECEFQEENLLLKKKGTNKFGVEKKSLKKYNKSKYLLIMRYYINYKFI